MFVFVCCVGECVLWCGLPLVGGRQRQSSANMFLSTKLIALLNFAARYCGIKVYARPCVLKKVNLQGCVPSLGDQPQETVSDARRYAWDDDPSGAHSLRFIRLHGVNHNEPSPTAIYLPVGAWSKERALPMICCTVGESTLMGFVVMMWA